MYYSIDRFEEMLAVLQDDHGASLSVARDMLPPDARQGDVLIVKDGQWLPVPDETARRKKQVWELQQRLLDRRKPGTNQS